MGLEKKTSLVFVKIGIDVCSVLDIEGLGSWAALGGNSEKEEKTRLISKNYNTYIFYIFIKNIRNKSM